MKNIPKELRDLLKKDKKHKYGAKRTTCLHKHDHDSAKEAMWCVKLNELQKEGKIRNLLRETPYDLRVNGHVICQHMPDFDFDILENGKWNPVVMDVKGMRLPVWVIKYKLFCALYPQINYRVV